MLNSCVLTPKILQYEMVRLHVQRSHYFKAANEPAFSADLFQGHGTLQLLACFLSYTSFLLACAADLCLQKNKEVLESK